MKNRPLILAILFFNGLLPLLVGVIIHFKEQLEWKASFKQGYFICTALCSVLMYFPAGLSWIKRKTK